jgi:hypothetical protein
MHRVVHFLLIGFLVALPGTGVPAEPGCDLKALAGKWDGTLTSRVSGRERATSFTFNEDGNWEHVIPGLFNPGPSFVGTAFSADGKCRWRSQTTGNTGIFELGGWGASRVLRMIPDDRRIETKLTPVK